MIKISVLTPTIRKEGLEVVAQSLNEQTLQDFEWLVEIGDRKKHDLNAAYNRLLRRARGELIVSVQDWIKLPPEALERFWEAYQQHPDTFFTVPVGKVKEWGDPPKWDWRITDAEMTWNMWEIDCGFAPLKALKEIGGFDEALDEHWSSDNVNVGCRADLAGYKFACLNDVRAVARDHDFHEEHPFRKNYNPEFNNQRMDEFRRGKKLDFMV